MVDHIINTDRRSDYLLGLCPVAETVEAMAVAGSETRVAVFTKYEVVEFILDLVGYTSDQPLYQKRLLGPSFGNGDFLFPAIEHLLDSWNKSEKRMAGFAREGADSGKLSDMSDMTSLKHFVTTFAGYTAEAARA